MRWPVLLLVGIAACGGGSPSPVDPALAASRAPSAPVDRYWRALRSRDVVLFESVFSQRERAEIERRGFAEALSQTIAFPARLARAAGVDMDRQTSDRLERWSEHIPIERFSYEYRGSARAGHVLAYLPADLAERVPHPYQEAEDGRVLVWEARVVRENGEWKLDER